MMSAISDSSPKTDAKYDIVKFFLSLMILAIHAILFPMVLYPWLRIAVPLFFVMTSYFAFSKMRDKSFGEHTVILRKFVIRNLQLYWCWFVILLPITMYIRRKVYFSNGFINSMVTILKKVLFGSTFVASWFITAAIAGVLIIYLLSKFLRNDCAVLFISVVSFCVVTLASSYSSIIAGTFIATAIEKYIDVFGELVCSYPAAIFWVFVGKLFAEQKIIIKSLRILICSILCSAIALFIEWKFVISLDGSYNNDSYFMLAPLCILLFAGIQRVKPTFWKYSVFLKRASTIIYVTHGSLLAVVNKLVDIVFHINNSLLSFVLTFLGCSIVYVLIEIAINKCKTHRIGKYLRMLY